MRALAWLAIGMTWLASAGAAAASRLDAPWPTGAALEDVRVESVRFPSHSPFAIADVGAGGERDPATEAIGMLFLPPGADAADPVPAAVLLHGAGGVRSSRELTYGRQLATMGIAALVIDVFASRRDRATGFVERLLEITESMALADAYAALRWFETRPEIDSSRVVLMGFSYGGMTATYAAYRQVAERFAPDGARFAGHVAFYGPCIARFEDPTTTGAPVLMLFGELDEITVQARCVEIAADLRRGGSQVTRIVYPGAYHQWDGGRGPWRAPRGLKDCALRVETDGDVRDTRTLLPMIGPISRRVILGLCSDSEGYLIAADDQVRARSNLDLGRFLAEVLAQPPAGGA